MRNFLRRLRRELSQLTLTASRRHRSRRQMHRRAASEQLEERALLSTLAVEVEDAIPGGGINNATNGSSPTSIIDVAGTTYFVATDSVNGNELWRINRSGIAELVEDAVQGGGIAAGSAGSGPKYLTNVNGTLYFSADNRGTNNPNLWRVNGAGVAEFVSNTFDGGITSESAAQASGATLLTVVNGTLYFKANSLSAGTELWRVNRFGVAEIVEDSIPDGGINPANSSDPRYLNNVNGTLYFRADDGTNGSELWRVNSSGTAEMVDDSVAGGGIRPGGSSSSPTSFTNVNGTLYFQANDGTNGSELWRIAGSGIAEMVEDTVPDGGIRPGSATSTPTNLHNVNGTLYFAANDGTNGNELWRINSAGRAEMVEDSRPGAGINTGSAGSYPGSLTNVNGTLYFTAVVTSLYTQLLRINSSGIADLVDDAISGVGISSTTTPANLTNANGTLYFVGNTPANGAELFRVNSSGIVEVVEDSIPGGGITPGANGSSPANLTIANGRLYFSANDGTNGNELWRINSSGIAEMVEDTIAGGGISPEFASSAPSNLSNANGILYFQAHDGFNGPELWRINSSGVAEMVEDAVPGGGLEVTSMFSDPTSLTIVNDTLYFLANDGTNGVELWRKNSLGVAEIVEDSVPGGGIRPGLSGSSATNLTNVGGTLYFVANDGSNGAELWRVASSGTAVMVEDAIAGGGIAPGAASSSPSNLTTIGGTLYFSANDGTNGRELWRINSAGAAVMVEDAVPGGGIAVEATDSSPTNLANVSSTLYFSASDGSATTGRELWRINSQGLAEIVEDAVPGGGIQPGTGSSSPGNLTEVSGTLYFTANDGTNGIELWRVNSSGVAVIVEDAVLGGGIRPGPATSSVSSLTNVGGTLYFSANDGTNGVELWRINSAGTAEMVEDAVPGGGIAPGSVGSGPVRLTNINDQLYFAASDGTNGAELWRINSSGLAQMIEDTLSGGGISPGSADSAPDLLTNVDGTLYFTATTVANGLELWRINSAGIAVMIEDAIPGGGIRVGQNNSSPNDLTNVNGTLYFSADDGNSGVEPWRINALGVAEIVEDAIPGGGLNPGSANSSPQQFTNVNGLLYFVAHNNQPLGGGSSNRELWKVVTDAAPPVIPPTPAPPLSSLAPVVDAGGSLQVFAGDQLSRAISFRDEDSSTFTITVNYGEGGGAETLDYRRDNRTMQLDHVFQKAGTYTVTVSVRDDSLPTSRVGTDSFQVTVLNTPPEVAFNEVLLTKRIREGETVNLSGTFEDLGQRDNHTIEVNWGDGTPIVPQAITVGARAFTLSHRYDDDGVSRADSHVYRVVVTVRDQLGAASQTPVFLVEVDNVLPSSLQTSLSSSVVNEGQTVTLNGSFIDPGVQDTHLVYVDWGDGTAKQKVPLAQIIRSGTTRNYSLTHAYLDNPLTGTTYTITVEVADDDEPLNSVTTTRLVTVNNILPTFAGNALVLSANETTEGGTIALNVSFIDPGQEGHTLIVDWGDGTATTTITMPPGVTTAAGLLHQYANATSNSTVYTIRATVLDRDTLLAAANSTTKPVAILNVAPTVLPPTLVPGSPVSEGDEVVISGFFTDAAIGETYTASVVWGDGATTPAVIDLETRTYTASHRYLDDPIAAGDLYSIVVSVNDGVQTGLRTSFVEVRNIAPTLSVLPVVDTSTNSPVFRAVAVDVSPLDQAGLIYSWTLTKNGVNVPFVNRSATEIELNPAMIPVGTDPLKLTTTVDDGDGGVTSVSTVLVIGTAGDDTLTITDSTFPLGQTSITVLGLGGNDILDASGITATGLHVTLYGGEGDDLLFDGTGSDTSILGWGNDSLNLPTSDPRNTTGIVPNMGGDDVVYLIPNSVLTAYDSVGHNTLNFSLADSGITQANGVTFDLELTQRSTIVAQDVAPGSLEPATHFVAALGVFNELVGSNYGDSLTGASNSAVFGGRGNDNFFTKDDITDATFGGGDDADVLTARGKRVARVRFDGDDGPDELHVDELAEVFDTLDFNGGDDADVFVNRGRVSRVIFTGGSDADVFRNVSGRIAKVRFDGDDGIDEFINEELAIVEWQAGDSPALLADQGLEFNGGDDADVFVNRGRASRVIFTGGADADVFRNQSGRIAKVRFDGDDGIDHFFNEDFATIGWEIGDDALLQLDSGLTFNGGGDADVFVNRGRASRVIFTGGADADLFWNEAGRIAHVRFVGDEGSDQFINEELAIIEWQPGDDPALVADQGLEFIGGDDADVFINRGRASRVIFTGGSDADVFQNQRGRLTRVRFDGDDGPDQFINDDLATIEWQSGDDLSLQFDAGIEFNGGDDADVFINRGRASRVIFTGGADGDVLQNQKGRLTKVRFDGDDGPDQFINDELATVEWQAGDDPSLQIDAGIEFLGGDDADVFINRGRASRVIFTGGADGDVLQNKQGRLTRVRFDGDEGDDIFLNEDLATVEWQPGDDPSLQFDAGIEFNGGDDADVFVNRGRASRVIFTGGADGDSLDVQAGEVTGEVLFTGGDDADVLIVRSRAGRVRFDGDAGPDEFLVTGTIAGTTTGDGLVEFNGGDDADVFVSRGTLRKVIFTGGADDNADDVLQTSGGSIQELEFISESGVGILVNRTNGIGSIRFTGSNEADMFINRGQNIGDITFIGAGGDDVFVNSGSTNPNQPGVLTFDAGDGSNAMRNEGTGWAEVIYTGGLGEDFLQNNATGIGLLSYDGGTGSNALENNASGISNIIVEGSNDNDIFANDGDNVSGIVFNALNGNNTLINTGANVSGITFNGGIDADRFINSGFALKNSTFHAEAGDDRLFNFGASMQNVTMIGGAGADGWINQASAGSSNSLTLQAGESDDAADMFINWAANVSNVIVDGGADDDLLQNGGLNSSNFQFTGGNGHDLLLNLGYGADQFTFDAGDGDDVLENRGRSGGTLRMIGGAGDDAFYQNAGDASGIELDGGDGDDTVLNFSSGMGRVALIGGIGIDILQNSGHDIGSLEVTGGDGKNTLQNFGHRVGSIRMLGSGTFAGGFDTLLNSGNTIGLIEVTSHITTTVISSGNDITSLSMVGSEFNDVVRVTGRNIQMMTVNGNGGDDSLLVDTQSNVGSSITYFGGHGDDLLIFRGAIDGLLFDGSEDDDQSVLSGSVNNAILRGGSGDDLYRFVGTPNGQVTIDEVFTGTSTVSDLSSDTLDFSSFTSGPITLDLAITTPQVQPTVANPLIITLTSGLGIENVVGTSGADTILGNARNNVLSGAQFLSPGSSAPGTPVARTKTQWVFLDFISSNDPGEHVYSEAEAVEVKRRIELTYAGFDVRFVRNTSDLPASISGDPAKYVTISFNQTPSSGRPGGESSAIDFGNVDPGGTATVQVNGLLGGREVLEPGLKAVAAESADRDSIQAPDIAKPESSVENFIALSAKIATHELAHLLGVRHYDAFGPVGFGINAPPGLDRFKPTFAGVAAAFETADHIISSPASAGTDRFNDLRQLYFGEREAIKLALAFSDQDQVRKTESTGTHKTQATAAPLNLVTLDVPNLATGGFSKDKTFSVQATTLVGSVGLASNGKSENDWYSFVGNSGDIVTIEVMSRALKRYYETNATSIDSVVRLYNAAGQLVQTFGTDAVNDDEFESSDSLLMDVTLPAGGMYFIEVDTFRRLPGDANYDAAVALRASLEARRNDTNLDNDLSPEEQQLLERLSDSLDDTDTGNYELLIYRSTSINATDGIDTIKGREGIDILNGGPGDDYTLSVSASGAASSNEASAWSGSYVISDRGGDSWTAIINYGDGSAPVTVHPSTGSIGTSLPLSHIYADDGYFTITVEVTNDDGQTHRQTFAVTVNNVDPTASLSGPTTGITGLPYTFAVTASDVAGAADPLTYAWTITRNGSDFATQSGGTSYSLTASLPGSYTISVTVDDGDGGVVTRSVVALISPASVPPAVTTFDVGSGRTQRSWIDFLDVAFSSEQLAADLMASPSRIKLTRFGLNGPTSASDPGTAVNFNPALNLSRSGSGIKLNFGAGVIGAGRNSNAADGYYQLSVDFDGNGTVDASRYFYRLLGEATGDRRVTGPASTVGTDVNRIQTGMTQLYNRELDINGDNVVNALDRYWAQTAVGRQLRADLHLDD